MYWNEAFVLILFSYAVMSFQQNDYTIEEDYAQLDYYNRSLVESFHINNLRPNRTFKGYSADVRTLIDLDRDSYIMNIKLFRFVNNQPRHLLAQLDVKVCDALATNKFGIRDVFNTANITGCPIKKGYYNMKSFRIPEQKLPPSIPSGKYRLQISCIYYSSTIVKVSFYGNVVYKIKY